MSPKGSYKKGRTRGSRYVLQHIKQNKQENYCMNKKKVVTLRTYLVTGKQPYHERE